MEGKTSGAFVKHLEDLRYSLDALRQSLEMTLTRLKEEQKSLELAGRSRRLAGPRPLPQP